MLASRLGGHASRSQQVVQTVQFVSPQRRQPLARRDHAIAIVVWPRQRMAGTLHGISRLCMTGNTRLAQTGLEPPVAPEHCGQQREKLIKPQTITGRGITRRTKYLV